MNYFSYPLTIVQTNIFEEPQNIFSQPKSQTPNYRASPPVFLTIECPPGRILKIMEIPLPYEDKFNQYNNLYKHEKFIGICSEYGVSNDLTNRRNQKILFNVAK